MYPSNQSDLGDDLDDRDSLYWEEHLGGPDDVDIEAREVEYVFGGLDESFEFEGNSVNNDSDETESHELESGNRERNDQILDWLGSSNLVHPFSNGQGFLVPRGPHVKLEDGSVADLIDWLVAQGFGSGCHVAGFSVVRTRNGTGFEEGLSFSKTVVDSPFMTEYHLHGRINETPFEDDIPF